MIFRGLIKSGFNAFPKIFLNRIQTSAYNSSHKNPFKTSELTENANDSNDILTREKKIKVLHLEIDVGRQEGRRVPNPLLLKPEHWDHLLTLNSRSARTKYYNFLWNIEKKKESKEEKRLKRLELLNERKEKEKKESEECNHILYALSHNCMFLRIYDSTMNLWNNNRLIQAMQFGEKLIFDCSYEEYMNIREVSNAAKQLVISFAENRLHADPFDIYFCNLNSNGSTKKILEGFIPTINEPSFPLNLQEKCFTEIFPKEKLVYLTPHCRNELENYNLDDIYIIGAMVDKVNNEPISLAKAKKLGLRMAKLPLDYYLQWGAGSGKSLTLNQMTSIMLDLKKTNDWNFALRHVPRRKLVERLEEGKQEKFFTKKKQFQFDIDSWGSNKKSSRN